MKISVIGTGKVGQTVSTRLSSLNHKVYMGTRNPEETKSRTDKNQMTGNSFADWKADNPNIELTAYRDLPNDSEIFVNATGGMVSLEALTRVGEDKMNGKILIDISNPLDFSNGFPPTLSVCNDNSLAEEIQLAFPSVKVVKSLNTMTTMVMMNPDLVPGDHTVFMSGNDENAKSTVSNLLQEIGWKENNILDLGDITTARGTEMMLPIWLRVWGALGTAEFNFNVVGK